MVRSSPETSVTRQPRVIHEIRGLMIVIGVVALTLTPIVWLLRLPARLRWALLTVFPMAVLMSSICWAPIIVEGIRNARRLRSYNPRTPRTPHDG